MRARCKVWVRGGKKGKGRERRGGGDEKGLKVLKRRLRLGSGFREDCEGKRGGSG